MMLVYHKEHGGCLPFLGNCPYFTWASTPPAGVSMLTAEVLPQELFCPHPRDTWQRLETFFVVTIGTELLLATPK